MYPVCTGFSSNVRLQPPRLRRHGAVGCSRCWASAFSAYDIPMNVEFTAVFRQVPEGYIGFVEELPGANTQGSTLEEARRNLQEAVELALEANRELIVEATRGQNVIREPLKITA